MSIQGRSEHARPRLGELVVDRALVSREHLEFCLAYQKALRKDPAQEHKPLGEIFVEKGLLRQEVLDGLLDELENWGAPKRLAPSPAAAPPKPKGKKRRRGKPRAEERPADAEPGAPTRRGRTIEILIAGAAVAAIVLAVKLWPDSGAQNALAAYLKSCAEKNGKPDASLAIRDLRIVVRHFEMAGVQAAIRYDYSGELRAYGGRQGVLNWEEFLAVTGMEGPKHQALSLLIPGFPEDLTPKNVGSLSITAQPLRCRLVFKPRGSRLFKKRDFRFVMLKAVSPRWKSGWRVAAYEPVGSK